MIVIRNNHPGECTSKEKEGEGVTVRGRGSVRVTEKGIKIGRETERERKRESVLTTD